MIARPSALKSLTAAILCVTAILVAPPIVSLVMGSFSVTNIDGSWGGLTTRNYREVLNGPDLLGSAVNTIAFALGATLVAIVAGTSQAWLVERTDAPLKILAYISAILSLATPFVLYVLGYLLLLGRVGPVNQALEWLFRADQPIVNANSLWGMILIEGLLWTPLVFLILAPIFRAGNPSFEEAAFTCGASRQYALRHITLKLAAPAVLAIVLLVFVRGLEAFEVPMLVGLPSKVNVLTTDIYLQLKMEMTPNFGRASAFAVLLIIVVAFMLSLYHRLLRHAEKYQVVTGKGYRAQTLPLGRGRMFGGAILALNFVICVVLPIGMLLWVSLSPYYQAFSRRALSQISMKNYWAVLHQDGDVAVVVNTLLLSIGAATVVMAIGGIAGWIIARVKPGAGVLDQLGTLPLVFPGVVLALALLQIFLHVPLPIYGTVWILLIAFSIRYLPYGFRYSVTGVVQLHRELEEAASVSGASLGGVLMQIVRPLITPALTSGWLFVFLLTARDLAIPLMLSTASSNVISEALYEQWLDGQSTQLAAMGIMWMALMSLIAIAFHLLTRRFGVAENG